MKKVKPTFTGGLIGALAGLLVRPLAVVAFCIPYADTMTEMSPAEIIMGLIPSSFVGLYTGAIAGLLSRPGISALTGAVFSAGIFAAWSNGPLELWVINIRFQWNIFIYFMLAGALYGWLGGLAGQKRSASKTAGTAM